MEQYFAHVLGLFNMFVEAGFDPFVTSWIVGILVLMVFYFIFKAILALFK